MRKLAVILAGMAAIVAIFGCDRFAAKADSIFPSFGGAQEQKTLVADGVSAADNSEVGDTSLFDEDELLHAAIIAICIVLLFSTFTAGHLARLRKSKKRLKRMLTSFPGRISVVDGAKNILFFSDPDADKTKPANLKEIEGPGFETISAAIDKVFETGQSDVFECVVNGVPRQVTLAPLPSALFNKPAVIEFVQVNSNLQKKQSELKNSVALKSAIFDGMTSKIVLVDIYEGGRFLFVNRAAADFFGLPANEVEGKNDYDFFPFEDAERYTRENMQVLETGKTLSNIVSMRTKSGRVTKEQIIRKKIHMPNSADLVFVQSTDVSELCAPEAAE